MNACTKKPLTRKVGAGVRLRPDLGVSCSIAAPDTGGGFSYAPDPMTGPDPMTTSRQCIATSRRTGKRCGAYAIVGGTVCKWHGGAAPQVRLAANERIAEMVDPALSALRQLVDTADSDSVRLSAIKDILDRAGYKPKERVEHSGPNGSAPRVEVVYTDAPHFPAASSSGTAADQG